MKVIALNSLISNILYIRPWATMNLTLTLTHRCNIYITNFQ